MRGCLTWFVRLYCAFSLVDFGKKSWATSLANTLQIVIFLRVNDVETFGQVILRWRLMLCRLLLKLLLG